ncbi:portal protein [Rhodococcus phage ReqiPine5]|uniref:Gp12 n=1 Tax=Rhodococcus phage ReqiPine5 TaxID=691963 RepID=D4P7Y7_9CAUD|nr:portal protein [Rhodococcus phage ReqiPine5]ADD81117.1 gp12 [Rhodococcus phage ReqiPine5]
MYPSSKAEAIVAHIEAEAAIHALAVKAYRDYSHVVLASIKGVSLTAAGNDIPIDPSGILDTSLYWESVVNEFLGYGVGLVYSWELVRTFEALGDTGEILSMSEPMPWPGESSETFAARAAEAERLVAAGLGVEAEQMNEFAQRLRALPTVRTITSNYLAAVKNRMVRTPETVFGEVTRVLDAGLEKGLSIPEQAAALNDTVSEASTWWASRAETVARTETCGAMSAATIDAAQTRNELLQEVLEQVWICTLDSKTRDSHFAADGQRVSLGAKFTVGSSELEYPGDPEGPAHEVINCRCRVAVLAADEPSPMEFDRHTERGEGDSTVKNRTGSRQDEIDRRAEDGVIRAIDDPNGVGRVASAAPEENNVADDVDTPEMYRTFTDQPLGVLGEPTEDRRLLAADMEVSFRDFPLPLMWVEQTSQAHMNGYVVGVIESGRVEDGRVLCSGYMLNTEEADKAADLIGHGVVKPSLDLNDVEWTMTDEAGNEVTYADLERYWEENGKDMKVFDTFTSGKVMGATLVAVQAIANARLDLNTEREPRGVASIEASLVASAPAITKYDPALFADPELDGPTVLQYDEETGRVFGHLACFGTCHTGFKDQCVVAPRSMSGYKHFHTSNVTTSQGLLAVGRLTVNTGHAGPRLSAEKAVAHYDDTGTCFALVRAGEDEHGIWVSGIVNPVASEEAVTAGLQSPLSGDWRKRGGHLELVAALAVNVPGFPIVASAAGDGMDDQLSLVASLAPRPGRAADRVPSAKEFAAAVMAEMRAEEARRKEAEVIFSANDARRNEEADAILRGMEADTLLKTIGGN